MRVNFNNQITETAEGIHLYELLSTKNLVEMHGIAVAVNMEVVARNKWAETILQNDDSVLVIKATQGG